MRKGYVFSPFLLILCGLSVPAVSAATAEPHRGFFLGAGYQSIGKPLFQYPGGGGEIVQEQSSGGLCLMGGYEYNGPRLGVAGRLSFFSGRFQSFLTPEMGGGSQYTRYVKYDEPKVSFFFFDMIIQWFPVENVLAVYGFLGLGSGSESYTISGATFADWNGSKDYSEFDFSYGFGVRGSPIKLISLFAEIRWVPGVGTPPDSYWVVNGISTGSTTFENHSTIFALGVAINI